ncbi:MAG: ParA family protein [Pseudomonadota bacterium]
MTQRIAIANRKGGVGKSTVTLAIATAYAAWQAKRVLVVDLDTQCNVSQALIGGQRWADLRRADQLISDYFFSILDADADRAKDRQHYVTHAVGEVALSAGKLSLLPGSLEFEDVQNEYILKQFRGAKDPNAAAEMVRGPIRSSLRRLDRAYDVVLYDCPPGLSMASLAAIELADRVIVPFKPDFISEFGVDRISMLIEGKRVYEDVAAIAFADRRYRCVANGVVADGADARAGRDRFVIDTIAEDHPVCTTHLPLNNDLRDAIDWMGQSLTMEEKFGTGLPFVRALFDELEAAPGAGQIAA